MGLGNNTPSYLPPEAQLPVVDELPSMRGMIKDPDDPDNDWAARTSTINLATGYIVILSLMIFGFAAQSSIGRYDRDLLFAGAPMLLVSFIFFLGLLVVGLVGTFGVVLFSLTIEASLTKKHSFIRRILRFGIIVFFSAINSIVWLSWGKSKPETRLIGPVSGFEIWIPSAAAASFYILFAITYRARGLFDIKIPPLAN